MSKSNNMEVPPKEQNRKLKDKELFDTLIGQLKMYESVDQDIEQSLRALWSTGNYKAAEKLIDKMIGTVEKESSTTEKVAIPEIKSAVNDNTLLRTLTPFEGNDVTEFKRWVETYDLAVSLAHQTLPKEQKEKLRCIYLASYLKGRAGQLRKDAYARMEDITFERLIAYIENNLPVPISIERTGRMRRVYFKNMMDDFEEHCNTFLEGTKAATGVSIDVLAGRSPGTMEPLQQLTRIDFINSFPFYIREHLEQLAFTSSLWEIKDAAFELVLRERNKLTRRNRKVSSPTGEKKNQQFNEDKRQERRQGPGYFKSRRIVNVINPQQPEDTDRLSEVEDSVELNLAGPIVPTVLSIQPRIMSKHRSFGLAGWIVVLLAVIPVIYMSHYVWDCNHLSSKSWNIAAPHRINCNNPQIWHLESRYVYRRAENNCTKTLDLLAVSNNFILIITDNPTLLYKTKENNQKCNVSAHTLSKGYLTNFVDNIWQSPTIPQEVVDDQIRLPEDMDESIRGIAIQLLLFKAGILVRQLDKTQWDALFINIFNAHYKEAHKRHIFRTITFTLVQQLVTPLYNAACVRLQKEFMDISKTIDPTEKMRIFLEREDIRASYHQGNYNIQTCMRVKPTSIFTDYRYQNMCYTFMPAIVNKSLKFVDQNNYLHEHSQGSPCVTMPKEEIQEIQQTERSDEGILESLGDSVKIFEKTVQVLELSVIHGIIIILGILACIIIGVWLFKCYWRNKRRGNRQRRRLLGRMSDMVEMRSMRPTVSVAVTQIGKQPMVDLYVHQEGQTKIARCLIDTGACVSFIRKKCVKHNTSLSLFTQPMTVATDFNNQPIKAIGKTSILFVFGRKKYVKVELWVVDDLRYDILIGSDVLEEMDRNNLAVTFKLAANAIQIGTIRYPLVRKASVAYLQPYEVWKTMRSWISLLQPPAIIQFPEDKNAEILDISTLDLPEEALADMGIWEPLPKESTLATINWKGTALSGRGRAKVALLIQKWSDAFIKHEEDIGRYKGPITHIIKLKPDVKLPYTGVPRHSAYTNQEAKKHIDAMLANGIIRPSTSHCTSRYLIVPKPNGTTRFVVDYRMINNATRIEVPCIPLIEDIIKTVSKYKYFSAFDVASGFHQIPLDAESRFLTAFNSPWGVYEFNTTPMGLSGSPGTFQRVMDNIFHDMKDRLLIYIDDIIIFSNDETEHIRTMNEFLCRIVDSGLKLRLDKSKFGVDELTYLGFRISQRGIEVDPAKSKAITELKQPSNLKQLRAFLGMTNFFRRFIPNYSIMTEPLRHLLKKDVEYKWTLECQKAFDSLKQALSSAPVLSSPKETGEFILQTDASYLGIGAVLFQKQPDLKVITYLSRSINQYEQNYPPIHLEALAIVWALSQIDSYVYGMPLTIITDHQPLISLFSAKDLKGKLARYQLRLMQYQAKIVYKPGGLNVVADYLSRQPVHYINMVMIDKVPWNDKQWYYSKEELQELQSLHEKKKIIKRSGRFYNLANEGGSGGLIPPKEKRKEFLEAFHQHPLFGSHFGWEKVQEKLRKLMDWQGIKEDYKELCRTCIQCKQNKTIPADVIQYKNQSIICGEVPLGKVNIDILQHGKKNEEGYIAVVIAVDTLTRFAMAAPIRKLTSGEVILALLRDIFFKYGIPKQIITDKGTCFVSEEFQDFIGKLGIVHHTCTANHHQSNGVVERLNRTINEAIRIYQGEDWIQTVNNTIFTYNDSIHPKTKLSPFYLMMGRHANYGVTEDQVVTTGEYKEEIKQWEEYLKELQQQWINQFLKSKESGDKLKGIEVNIHIGDQVMKKRIVNKRGTTSPWVGPYTVIGKDEHQRIHIKKGRKQEWLHVSQCKRFKDGGGDVKE